MNAFHDTEAGCNARMILTPQMHLGWNRELLKPTLLRFDKKSWRDGLPANYRLDKAQLATCHITSAPDLSRRLWEMFRSGEPRSLARFGELTEAVCRLDTLGKTMLDHTQASST